MKTAAEYAELAEASLSDALTAQALDGDDDPAAHLRVGIAQVRANLAIAAATLEAARLMGPTPEDQARLDALDPSKMCLAEWPGTCAGLLEGHPEAIIDMGAHDCDLRRDHVGPHRCHCGAEL